MPLQQIVIDEQSLDKLSLDLRDAADRVDFTAIQHVFSGHLVLASSGHIEKSVNHVLSEYGRAKGNLEIKRFVASNIAHRNALNCNKMRAITDQLNVNWWQRHELSTWS